MTAFDTPRRRESLSRPGTRESGSPSTAPASGTGFVGRAHELAVLRARLAAAAAGVGSVVLLAGEPGIGKTRLLDQVSAEAAERGCRVAWGRCWEGEGAPSFWAWVQIIRALVDGRDAAALRAEMAGGDIYLLMRILRDWDDEQATVILRRCREVIPPHGRLLVIDPILPPRGMPSPAIGSDLLLRVLFDGGRDRTENEFRDLLAAAGFALERRIETGWLLGLIEAKPV